LELEAALEEDQENEEPTGETRNGQWSYGAVPLEEGRAHPKQHGLLLSSRPFVNQLWSLEFAFLLCFQAIHVTRGNLYLGLLDYYYESTQFRGIPQSVVTEYITITSALVPLGCLCAPLVERIIDRCGFGYTAHIIAAIGAVYSVLMLSDDISLQLGTAVLFLVYRANVFAFPSAFAGQVFGARTVGRVSGMMYTLMSPVQFLLTPALRLTLTRFYDNFRPLNLIQLAALVPMVLLTCVLQKVSKEPTIPPPTSTTSSAPTRPDRGSRTSPEQRGMLPRSPGPSPSFSQTGPRRIVKGGGSSNGSASPVGKLSPTFSEKGHLMEEGVREWRLGAAQMELTGIQRQQGGEPRPRGGGEW